MRKFPKIDLFDKVIDRCVNELGYYSDGGMSYRLDLMTAHDDIGLDFKKLLNFPFNDFDHDIYGLACSIDRLERKVMNDFVPRCALPEEV
jgi:hypothetical protein